MLGLFQSSHSGRQSFVGKDEVRPAPCKFSVRQFLVSILRKRLPATETQVIKVAIGMDLRMSWKPRHEAHAIERVRVMLPFKEPLTSKALRSASADVVAKAQSFGFDAIVPAESAIQNIRISLSGGVAAHKLSGQESGVVLTRQQEGSVLEEVGFRDGGFGYLSTTYGR
jgi:hypothetical protein